MGIVLSALAGAAGGYDAAMDQDRKEHEAVATDVRRSGLEEQRQRALLLFKAGQEDAQRAAMADRVNTAAGSIADSAVSQKRGIVQNAIADPASWTADQQSAVDQSLALDRDRVASDQRTRTQAAIRTGDIAPDKAAALADSERRLDAAENTAASRAAAAERESERKEKADAQRYATDLKRLDLQAGTLEASNRKIDAWIENEAAKRDNDEKKGATKGASSERMYSIVNAMNATIKNLDESSKGKTDEERAEWKRQRDTAVRVRDRASAALDASLDARGAEAPGTSVALRPASPASAGKATPWIPPDAQGEQRRVIESEYQREKAKDPNSAITKGLERELQRLPGGTVAPAPSAPKALATRPPLSSFQK